MTIGYPPAQSQRPNDDERTVYLGSKDAGRAAGRPIPMSTQSDPRGQQPERGQQPYPQAPQTHPATHPQYAPQSSAGYNQYGWGNQAPPAPQSGGGSKVAIIAVAVIVAVISVATLSFALTRPSKHDDQDKASSTSQSADKSAGQPDTKPAESTEQTPTPAPTLAPSALTGVLMSLPEAAAVLGTSAMKGADELGDKIYTASNDTIVDQDCISMLPAEKATYQGSGYSDLRQQFLTGVNDDLRMTQSASTFTNAAAALRFVAAYKAKWEKCAGRTINFRAPDFPTSPDTYFVFGAVSQTDNVITIPSTQEGHGDWTCQNGLTTRANVVIDLLVCGRGMQPSVARAATDKISQKVTAALPR